MRVFGIQTDGQFSEYVHTPFQVEHEEAVLEDWLESNPDGIVEDGCILVQWCESVEKAVKQHGLKQ